MVEENQLVGLENNVIGTRVVAEAARDMRLEHFLLVSSDKAVRPKNMMGASKRMAELIVQDLATAAEAHAVLDGALRQCAGLVGLGLSRCSRSRSPRAGR